jgi:hypothetical protein
MEADEVGDNGSKAAVVVDRTRNRLALYYHPAF